MIIKRFYWKNYWKEKKCWTLYKFILSLDILLRFKNISIIYAYIHMKYTRKRSEWEKLRQHEWYLPEFTINKRSSNQRSSLRIGVLRNFAKFTGKPLCQSLFLNKVAGVRPATLLKKRLRQRCFPVNFAKLIRTSFLQNTSGQLHL